MLVLCFCYFERINKSKSPISNFKIVTMVFGSLNSWLNVLLINTLCLILRLQFVTNSHSKIIIESCRLKRVFISDKCKQKQCKGLYFSHKHSQCVLRVFCSNSFAVDYKGEESCEQRLNQNIRMIYIFFCSPV